MQVHPRTLLANGNPAKKEGKLPLAIGQTKIIHPLYKSYTTMFKTKLFSLLCLLVFCSSPGKAQDYIPQIGDTIASEEGVFIVSGENLIANPQFDDGFDNWTAGDGAPLSETYFTIVADGGPDGSPCLKSLSSAGSATAQSVKTGWALTLGKTYLFSCWAMRESLTNAQYSRLYLSDTQTGTNEEIATLTYEANTWVQTQIIFTADRQYLVANFGWLGGPTSFDCFFLGEVEASSELFTDNLVASIQSAEELLATTEEGTERGQYSTEVRNALQEAIDTAEGILGSATTQQEINDANTTLQVAMATYEEDVNPPFVIGEMYTFTNLATNGELYLSTGGGTVMIIENTESNDMVFTFEPATENAPAKGYYIKDLDGNYIYRSGTWNTLSSATADLNDANSIFQIVDYGTFVQIKNMGSGSVLGPDATTPGAAVYSNKNGLSSLYCWVLEEYVPVDERDDKYYFEKALASAQSTYNAIDPTLCGTGAFMISSDAYDAFGNALEEAQGMTDYVAARELIEAAVAEFEANMINPAVEGMDYRIIHSSELTLYHEEGSTQPILAATDETTRQSYVFETTDVSGTYYIKNLNTGSYLAKSTLSTWDTQWLETPEGDEAKWSICIIGEKSYSIQNLAGQGYLGTDATTDGAFVYCDKSASATNSQWNVSDGSDEITLDWTDFNDALAQAQEFYEGMVEGYDVGEYFDSDIQDFAGVMTQAQTDARNAKDQETLDAVAEQLLADIEIYKGKAHTESVADEYLARLIEECQTEHDAAVVGIEKGNYTEEAKSAFQEAIDAAKEATDYEDGITKLFAARETFRESVQTVDRAALKAEIEADEERANSAVAGNFDGQYPAEAIETFKAAIAVAQEGYDNVAATQEDIDAILQVLQAAAQEFANSVVVIDFSSLRNAISDATQAIADAEPERGEGPGKYPESAFSSLQGSIDAAQAIVGSKEVGQQAVDDQTAELEEATLTFLASRVPNDYSELEALLEAAEKLYAEVTENIWISAGDKEILAESIEKGRAAMEVTDQDEIDKVCKILKRDIELFTTITGITYITESGISQSIENGVLSLQGIPAGTQVAVFSLNGICVATSSGASSFQASLPQGLYVVTVSNGKERISIRVVVD